MTKLSLKWSALVAILALGRIGTFGISVATAGDIWDGTNDTTLVPTGDPNWSNPANWNLDTLPDFLGLTFAGTVGLNNNNDTTGTTITGAAATPAILFDASAGAFVIGGNAVTLGTAGTNNTANITNSSTNLQTINFNISLPVVSTITMTAGGGNVTLGGIISGFGGLTTAPAASGATLTLNGANTYTGATTVANGTVLNVGNSLALQNSAVTLNSTTANSLTFATGVTSATLGSLASAAGAGSFALTNASAAAVALTAGGNNTSTTHNGNLTGIGSLTKTGFGALTLASTSNTYGGGTNLNGGTLSISADTNIGGATSAINFNGGILQITSAAITNLNSHVLNTTTFNGGFDIANPLTISQSLSGSGSLLKAGAGVLTLAGTNSYSGGTTILAGTIQGGLTNFVAGGNIADFGTVAINQTSSGAWAGGTINGTGGLSVSTGTAGSVTISLGGTNLYTGGTTVGTTTSGSTGVLSLTGATAIQNSTVTIAVGTGVNNTLNFATGIGTFTLGGLASAAGTANIALTDGTNPVTLIVGNNNANTTFNGVLSGTTGALTKIGTGTLTLAGSNTYTGRTTVNRGGLTLGTGVAATILAPNASELHLGGGTLTINNLTTGAGFNSTFIDSGAAAIVATASTGVTAMQTTFRSIGATLNFTLPTATGTITINNPNDGGGILGGWATVGGTDWATRSGSNVAALASGSYTNDTWSAGNNTTVTTSSAPPASATTHSLRFNAAGSNTLTLSGTNVITSGGILMTNAVGANVSTITGGTLEGASSQDLIVVQNDAAGVLSIGSLIANNFAATALTKSGSGLLILTNASNSYSGGINLNGGLVQFASNGNLGFGAAISFNGGGLQYAVGNTVDISTRTLSFGTAGGVIDTGGNNVTFANAVGNNTNGALIKSGIGTLTLTAANTFHGGVGVNQGTLSLDFTGGGAPASDIISNSGSLNALALGGGTLQMLGKASTTNSQSFTNSVVTGGSASAISLVSGASGTANLNLGQVTRGAGGVLKITLPASGNISVAAGSQIGRNQLSPGSTGVLTGTGNNAYAFITDGSGNLVDFAAVDSSNHIVGASTIASLTVPNFAAAGNPNTGNSGNVNLLENGAAIIDFSNTVVPGTVTAVTGLRNNSGTVVIGNGVRFNTPRPDANTWQLDTGAAGRAFQTGAILVTANVGATNVTTLTAGGFTEGRNSDLVFAQDNPNAYFINVTGIGNGGDTVNVIKIGKGTVSSTNAAAGAGFTGSLFLDEGTWLFNGNVQLGAVATGAAVNINGGNLVANANVTLDNAGANQRPIALGSGLNSTIAATTNNTITVTGVVSDSIAGSSANLTIGTGTIVGSGSAGNAVLTGDGAVALSGVNTYSGTTTVNNATLQVNGANALGRSPSLTLNNATLRYAAASANGSLDISTNRSITFAAGGATINTNGNSVTLANSIGGGGAGPFTYNDTAVTPGKLTLGGANSFSGGTTITRGTLLANNTSGSALGSGPVMVNAGATLGGTGTISGTVTLSSGTGLGTGAILAPGGSVGTLNLGGLTAGNDTVFTYEFASLASYDTTNVTGLNGLSFDGSSNAAFHLFAVGGITPWSTPGTYNVVQFSGSNQGNALDSTWTTASGNNAHIFSDSRVGGLNYRFAISGNFLQLIIGGTPPAGWNFNGDGNWGDGTKWSGGTAPNGVTLAAIFGTGSTVTVNAPTVNVTVEAPKTVGGINFSNSTTSYNITGSSAVTLNNNGGGNATILVGTGNHTISAPISLASDTDITVPNAANTLTISGAITGSNALNKAGDGTLVLNAANTGYSGTTSLLKGTLQLGNNTALGSGALNVTDNATIKAGAAGLTVNNALTVTALKTATLNTNANTLTLTGAIAESGGAANVTVSGGGTLVMTADNNYTGVTTISAGTTLQFGNGGTTGSLANSPITNNGTLRFNRSDTGSLAITQPISGTGAVVQAGTGTTHLQVNNTYSGTTTISAGTLVIESPLAMQNSSLTYNTGDGTLVFGDTLGNTAATGATIGSLAGNRDIALMNNISDITLTVGGNGATTSYTGILSDSPSHLGALVKAGAGTMTLTAAETYGSLSAAVTTTVTGGILIISPTASLNGGGIQANAGAGGIQNTGGTITVNNAANSAFQGGSGGYTQTAGTANFGTGTITLNNNSNNVALLGLSGGSFTAANMNTTRCSLAFTAEPAAGSTTDGVYVSGTATVHFTGTVNVGTTGGNNNSGVSMRTDGGTTTVDGPLTVQLNNQGRWSILDVNGGSLTVGDVNTGVQLGGTSLGQAVFQMRAGTATVGRITFGAADNANDGVLNVTGGTLYVGSGGMARGAPGGTTYNAIVRLGNGTIGAAADWSAAADINANNALTLAAGGNVNGGVTINGILLNGDATTGITFKAADAVGTPHNITINAPLTGAGALTKTGLGILTLTAANTNTGNMNVNQGTLLLGASNTIATTPRVNLNGGTLNTDGLAQAITSTVLHASATSTLDFGDSLGNPDTVQFSSNTASDTWTAGAFLRIANWTSTSPLSGGGPDKLFAGAGGLSSAQLSHIHFSPYKTGSGAQILSSGPNAGEVVPLSTAIVLKQGDLNQDTHTNVSDVGALMATLSDVPKYANGLSTIRSNNSLVFDSADMLDLADLSNDNLVNNLDVQSLINILANGGGSAPGGGSLTAVPEPSSIVLAGVAVPALAYALRRRAVGRKSA